MTEHPRAALVLFLALGIVSTSARTMAAMQASASSTAAPETPAAVKPAVTPAAVTPAATPASTTPAAVTPAATQDSVTPAVTPPGTTCKAPEFGVKLDGERTISVVMASDPPGRYTVTVCTLSGLPDSKCGDAGGGLIASRVLSVGNKTEIGLDLSRSELVATILRDGGQVRVKFHSEETGVCKEKVEGERKVQLLERHRFAIDVGSVFALETGGSWKSNPELAVIATSRFSPRLRGAVDIRYSSLGAIASPTPTPTAASGTTTTPATSPTTTPTPFNPFTSSAGILRADFSLIQAFNSAPAPEFGVVGGFGLTTVPGVKLTKVDARHRFFLGPRIEVRGYNAGQPADTFSNSRGHFQVTAAWDDLWRWDEQVGDKVVHHNDPWRVVTEGELEIPQIGSQYLRLSLRLIADLPTRRSNTLSDIRISALATLDPALIPRLFGGGGATQASK